MIYIIMIMRATFCTYNFYFLFYPTMSHRLYRRQTRRRVYSRRRPRNSKSI